MELIYVIISARVLLCWLKLALWVVFALFCFVLHSNVSNVLFSPIKMLMCITLETRYTV